tara:strand:+ start:340 stop:2013 length:1674 start_codon:yes stop_codon:yes gene_type:complete
MALTRITGTVIEDDAISANKIGNAVITTAMIAQGAITADKLGSNTASDGPSADAVNLVQDNVVRVGTNLISNTNSVAANVTAITDATTDLNIGSGKYVFDKSITSFGINNTAPIAGTVSLGVPANVILKYSTLGGNVIIGGIDDTTPHRLDVRGTANTGALTATSFVVPNDGDIGSTGATDAIQISSGGIVTFKDDIKIKDGGTIGTATDPAAITIAAAGGVTFSDRSTHSSGITVADGGQIGSATTAAAITIAADGLVTVGDDLSITGNLTVLGSTTTVNTENLVIQDNFMALANSQPHGSATSLDSGIFFNRGSAGNAALYYDQSSTGFRLSETRDPFSNTVVKPTHDANLTLSNVFAETIKLNGADLATMISDNRSGAVSTVFNTNLTAARAVVSDGSGKISVSAVTATEIGHLDGVTSAIQTQIDTKIATTTSASNDFVTFARLNANLNVIQDNVAAITGGGTLLKLHSNSNVQAAGSTANTFFIGTAMPGDGLANIISVSLSGITQQKDVPSGTFASNNDFVMNAVAAHASIKFTRASIPVGTKVTITALKA